MECITRLWPMFRSSEEPTCKATPDVNSFCHVCGSLNSDEMNCLLECNRCLIKVYKSPIYFIVSLRREFTSILITCCIMSCRCIRLVMAFPKFPKVIGIADHAGKMPPIS